MASIKRELKVKFSTTGDGEVTRSIVNVDNSLKGAASSGEGASKSIGDLSEALDQKLEGSVGKAFKATDRLNSIVGQVTGAIGLATLAVGAITAAYELATKALNKNTDAQRQASDVRNQATRELDAYLAAYARMPGATAAQIAEHVEEAKALESAARRRAKAAAELKAAKDAHTAATVALRGYNAELDRGLSSAIEYRRTLDKRKRATDRLASADRLIARATEEATLAEREYQRELDASLRRQNKVKFGTEALAYARFYLNKTTKAAAAAANSIVKAAEKEIDANRRAKKAIDDRVESLTQMERRIAGSFSVFDEQIGRAFTLYDDKTRDEFAEFTAALEGLIPVAQRAASAVGGVFGMFTGDGTAPPAADAMDAATAAAEQFGNAAASSLGQAAAAALVYGESFSEVAAQAIAGLAAQAVSEAAFQSAKALAYLGVGLFTGSPQAFAAASQAAAAAAAFGAIAAVTVPAARASGSASGGGGGGGAPAGPSAQDAGIGGPSGSGGGGDTIIINTGQPVSTEADIGAAVGRALNANGRRRGSVRVNRRALRRA